MAANDQYKPGAAFFGMDLGLASTGAPGSQGVSSSDTAGGVVGTVTVTAPGTSSQAPQPVVTVTAGATTGSADDVAAHVSAISPGPAGDYASTGAGQGRSVNSHPDAGQ